MRTRKFASDFKAFMMRGNVLDLAVGVMIGGAFGKIVTSLVSDLIMPLIGVLTGGTDLKGLFISLNGKSYPSIEAAAADGASTVNYGAFLTSVLDFLIIAFCVFLIVRFISLIMPKKTEAPKAEPRRCPYCRSEVDEKASRCPHCTSDIKA